MQKIVQYFLCVAALIISFTVSDKADAAEVVEQKGNVFGSPQVTEKGVKMSISGTVRFIRHTKFSNPEFSIAVATKQLRATTRFTATQYNCPGYYFTRAYSDTNGASLVGYAYVHVTQQDATNKNCQNIKAAYPPETPPQQFNATHPISTVNEKSKMVSSSTTVSPTQPKTISNPETVKDSDKTVFIDPTDEETEAFFKKKANYDACLDRRDMVEPGYMSRDGGFSYECVELSNCMYPSLVDWYCNSSAKNFKSEKAPTGTTIHYDIPEYTNYRTAECEDNSEEDNCNYMDEVGMDKLPTGQLENANTPIEPEPEPEPEPEIPLNINACKGDYEVYGILFDGIYQMPWELSNSDIQASGMETTVNYINQLYVILESDTASIKVGNSNTLTNDDFIGAPPCPTQEAEPGTPPQESEGLHIFACRVDGTTNQYEMRLTFSEFDNSEISFTRVQNWIEYPTKEQAVIMKEDGGKMIMTILDDTADFALYGYNDFRDDREDSVIFYSNRLTAAQIKQSEICTTSGTITEPGDTNDSGNDGKPSCYCENLDNLGAGLGYMCCVWECPGLKDIIADGKQFLSDDLVGTAEAPPVPEFNPPPMPNIFDVLNGVDAKNQPDAPTGQNAPGLEDAGFTADDVKKAAPEIEFREDDTGGFNIIDPISNLPKDGSTAPRPKESTAEKPDLKGGSSDYNGTATPPGYNGTATPPKGGGTATPPGYDDKVKYPGT